ncbi:MAG: ABC transporter ATP-binding protein [Gammaproteobacteria bacterium]|nr:ABC transporter ATP-binding protein [Gammaproteobacteria bacterium]
MLKKINGLLTARERRRGLLVLVMVLMMALLETAGVASVMPFLSVLGNPEVVESNPVLATVYKRFGFESVDSFIIALGVAAFFLILFSALFRTLTHYVMNRYVEMRRHSIGERLLETYLRQPYAYFLDRHSSDMAKSILSEVDQLVSTVLRPGIDMVAYMVVTLALVTLLIVIDPWLAAGVAAVIGSTYSAIYLTVRGILGRVGRDRAQANRERFTAAGEALAGIKDIKLLGREQAYLSRFRGPSIRQASHQATNRTLSLVPKYLVEAIGFGGVIVLTLVLFATQGGATGTGLGGVLPLLGLYVFAGYRLLPAAQHIYKGVASLRFGVAAVDGIYEDLQQRSALEDIPRRRIDPILPKESVALTNVSYTYPNAPRQALRNIDLSIPIGTSLGLIGTTGAGKTTLVDLILGLLRPTNGAIAVDGRPVTDTEIPAWQRALGYVPQDIFLTDSSVAENIALGIPSAEIDYDQVVRCARMAQVHDFVTCELPGQYDAVIGERGVRLSGGQRQRIGIARALYHDPAVLVFDEATSALDIATEEAVMEAIDALKDQKTVILVAHRLSTVRQCTQIVRLEAGAVVQISSGLPTHLPSGI